MLPTREPLPSKPPPPPPVDWKALDYANNPFLAASAATESTRGETPLLEPSELEDNDRRVPRVDVLWQGDLLKVEYPHGPAPFQLATLPGAQEADAASIEQDGDRAVLVLRAESRARVISRSGDELREVEALGAGCVPLDSVERVEVEAGPLTYRISLTAPGKPTPRVLIDPSDRRVPLFFALATLVGGGLIAAMATFTPPLGLTDDEGVDKDALHLLQQYLHADAEREREPKTSASDDVDSMEGGPSSAAASGPAGTLGRPEAREQRGRLAVNANLESPSRQFAREAMLEAATNFGMIGLLNSFDVAAPVSPFATTAAGNDPSNAYGDLWSDEIGDRNGSGGLTLSGTGLGGGNVGDSTNIGLGRVGTCEGELCSGFGRFGKAGGPGHRVKSVSLRHGGVIASGRLPPEVIQRIVRQNYGRFRACYETGLRENPSLEGRISARFVVARDGSVATVQSAGSDLPNANVVRCVIDAYRDLSFPPPENGVVTVVYPLMLSPTG